LLESWSAGGECVGIGMIVWYRLGENGRGR
jgi:hypothetical protein